MSTDRSCRRGIDVGPSSTTARTRQKATPAPAAPPSMPRTRLSVSNCAISWRRLAPRAARTATSRPRACPRASSRFATFAQAMSSTSVDGAEQGHQRGTNAANNPLVQRSGQQRRVLFCLRETPWPGDRPPFAARLSPGRPTRCPSSAPIPAPTVRRVPRARGHAGLKMSGCQNSAAAGNLSAAGATPTIVTSWPSSVVVEFTTSGRPPNRRRQRPSAEHDLIAVTLSVAFRERRDRVPSGRPAV